MKNLFLIAVTSLILMACGADNKELIVGKWREINTGSSLKEFKADGTYTVAYDDGSKESGKYRIEGTTLFNTEDGTSQELNEEIALLDDENLTVQVEGFGMTMQTKYKREK